MGGGGGGERDRPLVPKEEWDVIYQYSWRGGKQVVNTHGVVGDYYYAGKGGCVCIRKCY